VDASAGELDEEEHVHPLCRNGLDGEEVDREHALGLRPQKGTPGESGALADRPEPCLPEDLLTVVAETVMLRPRSSPAIR
jgi:hypothetical protein